MRRLLLIAFTALISVQDATAACFGFNSHGQLGSGNRYPLKLAASTLMTIPVAILFFVFQRRIMNTASGALKE